MSLGHIIYSPADIEAELFNTSINNFKSLKHLELYNIKFKNTFIFKLTDIDTLILLGIENICFDKCINVKKLKIGDCKTMQQTFLTKLPKIEYLVNDDMHLGFVMYSWQDSEIATSFDFSSFNNLKNMKIYHSSQFLLIKNTLLEEVSLITENLYDKDLSVEIEQKIIEKLISIKTLKKIVLKLDQIDDSIISEINDENTSVAFIEIHNFRKNCILENFQKKFHGLSKLIIRNGGPNVNGNDNLKVLEIKENKQLKTDKIIFTGGVRGEIKIYINSFETLKNAFFTSICIILLILEIF